MWTIFRSKKLSTQQFIKVTSVYDLLVPRIDSLGPANAWRSMWKVIPQVSRFLDIGCSTGYLGAWLIQTRGCIVECVDMFEPDICVAKKEFTQFTK